MEHRGERTVTEVAEGLGVRTNQLHQWRVEMTQKGEAVSKPSEAESSEQIRRLQKRVRELEMEREILKKAAAFFAKENL